MEKSPQDLLLEVAQRLEHLQQFGALFGRGCQLDLERAAALVHDVLFCQELAQHGAKKSAGFVDAREVGKKIDGDE